MVFATLSMTAGKVAIEDNAYDPKSAGNVRGSTENTKRLLASQSVRTSIIRLPPVVHGEGDRNGFIPFLIQNARKKGESAYLGGARTAGPQFTNSVRPASSAWH